MNGGNKLSQGYVGVDGLRNKLHESVKTGKRSCGDRKNTEDQAYTFTQRYRTLNPENAVEVIMRPEQCESATRESRSWERRCTGNNMVLP